MQMKNRRWFWLIVELMCLIWIAFPALAAEKKNLAGKVAVVNGSLITQEDFDREMIGVKKRLAKSGKSLDDSRLLTIKKKILENLIDRELLYQESQKKGIKADEAEINEQWEKLKKQFPSEAEFKTALRKVNLSEAIVRSQIKRGLVIKKLIDKQIIEKVTVLNKEIKTYYESNPGSFKQPEQVRASHILIKLNPKADGSQKVVARKKIEEVQMKLKKGEDFAALAKEFSEGPSSVKGGDLGYFNKGQMVKSFEKVAFALKPGEVSGITETRFGYHLIKVADKKHESIMKYEEIKDRLQQYLKQQKTQEKLDIFLKKLKGKAKVEIFLNEISKSQK